MGLTNVKLRHYDTILGTIAYCFIDISLAAFAKALEVGFSKPTLLIFLIVGTSVTIVGMIVLSIYAKKKYAKLKEKVLNRNNMSISTSDANGGRHTDSNSGAAEHSTSHGASILGVITQSQCDIMRSSAHGQRIMRCQYTSRSLAARNRAVSWAVSTSVNVWIGIGSGSDSGSVTASGAILDDTPIVKVAVIMAIWMVIIMWYYLF